MPTDEDLAALAVCRSDPRWMRMAPAARETWLTTSRRGKSYAVALAAIRLARERDAREEIAR